MIEMRLVILESSKVRGIGRRGNGDSMVEKKIIINAKFESSPGDELNVKLSAIVQSLGDRVEAIDSGEAKLRPLEFNCGHVVGLDVRRFECRHWQGAMMSKKSISRYFESIIYPSVHSSMLFSTLGNLNNGWYIGLLTDNGKESSMICKLAPILCGTALQLKVDQPLPLAISKAVTFINCKTWLMMSSLQALTIVFQSNNRFSP